MTHTQEQLTEILQLHRMWRRGEDGGARAYLREADLSDADLCMADLREVYLRGANLSEVYLRCADLRWADLRGANLSEASLRCADLRWADLSEAELSGADLRGAVGNMREVKSAQFDQWDCSWSCSPDGVTTLNIGCQSHPLEIWKAASPEWIADLDPAAADWLARYGRILLELVEASPATPWGKPAEVSR